MSSIGLRNLGKCLRQFCTEVGMSKEGSLVGRHYLEPQHYNENELKSLLWTAAEFKAVDGAEFNQENRTATFLLSKADIYLQSAMENAAAYVKLPIKVIVDSDWEKWNFAEDVGRILGKTSDLIFLQSRLQTKAQSLAKGAGVPVVLTASKRYDNIRALSDILTIQETLGFLNHLPICWIGGATPLINTYLLLFPRLEVELRVFCALHTGVRESPALEKKARSQGKCFLTNVKTLNSLEETVKGTKILVIGHHDDVELQLNFAKCQQAAEDFYIIHSMPRNIFEIETSLFESNKNLTWTSFKNMQWILAAFMVRCLADYKHITKRPDFGSKKS